MSEKYISSPTSRGSSAGALSGQEAKARIESVEQLMDKNVIHQLKNADEAEVIIEGDEINPSAVGIFKHIKMTMLGFMPISWTTIKIPVELDEDDKPLFFNTYSIVLYKKVK